MKAKKRAIPRSFDLTMSMRTYNDIQQLVDHIKATTRGDLRRRAGMVRHRLEKALSKADRARRAKQR